MVIEFRGLVYFVAKILKNLKLEPPEKGKKVEFKAWSAWMLGACMN